MRSPLLPLLILALGITPCGAEPTGDGAGRAANLESLLAEQRAALERAAAAEPRDEERVERLLVETSETMARLLLERMRARRAAHAPPASPGGYRGTAVPEQNGSPAAPPPTQSNEVAE